MADPGGAGSGRPRTTLGVVFLVLFVDLIGFSIVFPLFGDMLLYYQQHDNGLIHWALGHVTAWLPHASAPQRAALFGGVLAAVYSGLQFIFAPVWGRLSDRFGRRPLLLVSILGTTTAYALWIISSNFSLLLVSRIIAGAMTGNISVANAAVADITTHQTRARAMGLLGIAFGLGFIIGPAIGGISWGISVKYLPVLSDPHNQWLNPFSLSAAVACGLSLLNLVWALTRFSETLPVERRSRHAPATRTINPIQLLSPALGAGVARINLAFLMHTVLFAGMEATLVFLTAERCGYTPQNNGWLFAWMGLVSAMVQGGLFRTLSARIGQKPLVIAGFIAMFPGFACIGLVDWFPHGWLLIVGVTILASGTGLIFPGLNTLASLAGDPERQGWVMGTFRSSGALGRALGPLLGAILYFAIRPSAPYLLGAVGMLLPMLLMVRLRAPAAGASHRS